jgi:hypothetical protein
MILGFITWVSTFLKTSINLWFIAFLGVLLASLWGGHVMLVSSAVTRNTAAITASLNKEYQRNLDRAVSDAIASTQALQKTADTLKGKKYATLETINRKLSADVISLQQRATRPTDATISSDNTPSGATCTAAQLYREDAEFLAREAARAEGVLIERNYYYDRYEDIRKSLPPK